MNIEEQIQKLGFEKQPPLECFFSTESFIYKRDNFFITNHNFCTHNIDRDFITVFLLCKRQRKFIFICIEMFEDLKQIENELTELLNN